MRLDYSLMRSSEAEQQITQNFLFLSRLRGEGRDGGTEVCPAPSSPAPSEPGAWTFSQELDSSLAVQKLSTARLTMSNEEDPRPCKVLQCSVSLPAEKLHCILGFI